MYRTITFAAALLTASTGLAQPIAYVKGSTKGDAIYVINLDGTGETRIYQAPRVGRFGGQVDRLTISPNGSEVAFILNDTHLMIQDVAGPASSATEISVSPGCALYDPDYRADGGLYVADSCGRIWLVDTDSGTASAIVQNANVSGLSARGNDLLYVDAGSVVDTGSLKLRLAADGSTTTIGDPINYTLPLYVDAVGSTGVLSGRSSYRTINLSNAAQATGCTTGGMVDYSPEGTQMVYEFRNMLFVLNSDCSGAPFRLARGADAVDW